MSNPFDDLRDLMPDGVASPDSMPAPDRQDLFNLLKAPFKKMVKAHKVSCEINIVFVETLEDVELIKKEWMFSQFATGKRMEIKVEEVEIPEIPQQDRRYVEWLRD